VATNPLGGIRSYLLNNIPRLMEAGYVFTFLSPEGEAFDAFKCDVNSWPGVEYIDVPVRKRKYCLWPSVRRALRTGRYALIHSQGLRSGVEASFANYFIRVPHVITLHDTRHESEFQGRFGRLKQHLVGRLSAQANLIIAVSNDCARNHLDFFPRWKRSRCRIEVIYNGVDVERLKAGASGGRRDALRKQFGWNEEITILGYFGRLMPEKGFLVLLDALRELARLGYADRIRLIATKDPHGYRGEYMREVERDETLAQMVQFVEPVADIATMLPQIDVLVIPSLREACPLLPMEAMVLGIPVVGSDAIGLREVLHGTPSLVPAAGNVEALAGAIIDSMGTRSTQQTWAYLPEVCKRFDNSSATEKLRHIYGAISW